VFVISYQYTGCTDVRNLLLNAERERERTKDDTNVFETIRPDKISDFLVRVKTIDKCTNGGNCQRCAQPFALIYTKGPSKRILKSDADMIKICYCVEFKIGSDSYCTGNFMCNKSKGNL
jgi:hypothetical protein